MFFSRSARACRLVWSAVWVLPVALALAPGCTRGGLGPGGQGAMQLSASDAGCLNGAGDVLAGYLAGTESAARIAGLWDCADHSLQLFADRTRGENPGVYSPQELRSFLEKYFLRDLKLSDALLTEAMELKRTVLGGSGDELTLDEISRTRQLIAVIREQSLKLQPFMPLTPDHVAGMSQDQVLEATSALIAAAREISKPLQATGYPYPFERLSRLLGEFEHVAPAGMGAGLAEQVRAQLPLIESLKGLLIEPEGDRIAGNEWGLVLTTGARWYSLALKFSALNRQYSSWSFGPGREALVAWAHDAAGMLRESLGRHPRRTIPFAELDALLAAEIPDGFAVGAEDKKVTLKHAQEFLRPVFRKLLGGAVQGRQLPIPGLTDVAVARLLETLDHWAAGQRYIETVFGNLASVRAMSGIPDYKAFSAADLLSLDPESMEWGDDPVFERAARSMQAVLRAEKPWFDGDENELSFAPRAAVPRYTAHDLTEMNWAHELARAVLRGYAGEPGRALSEDDNERKVNAEEFALFVNDIRDITVDIKFLDPSDHTQAAKRFREGNLFTFSGNGDEFISVREAAELFTLMLSAQRLTDRMHAAIAHACQPPGVPFTMDDFDYPKIDAACYRRQLFGRVDEFWREFPGMIAFFRSLSEGDRAAFEHNLEDAARKRGYSGDPMNSTDSQGFAAVVQYIESVFQRYDADGDGVLSWSEADAAFPVFRGALREISCMQGNCLDSDGDLKTVFTYLLKHGEPPSVAQFLWWKVAHGLYSLDADRGKIVLIFAKLGASTTPSSQ